MTYEEYQAESMRRQRDYIQRQRLGMQTLDVIRQSNPEALAYKRGASNLGYHPLTAEEITARIDQLADMEARIEETHGDTPTMRLMYEFHMDGIQ